MTDWNALLRGSWKGVGLLVKTPHGVHIEVPGKGAFALPHGDEMAWIDCIKNWEAQKCHVDTSRNAAHHGTPRKDV